MYAQFLLRSQLGFFHGAGPPLEMRDRECLQSAVTQEGIEVVENTAGKAWS